MATAAKRSERIEARITPDGLAILREAAELEGRSLSEFVVSAAEKAARTAIDQDRELRLSLADQKQFVESLLNPSTLAPAMRRAHDHRKRLIEGA